MGGPPFLEEKEGGVDGSGVGKEMGSWGKVWEEKRKEVETVIGLGKIN